MIMILYINKGDRPYGLSLMMVRITGLEPARTRIH